MDLRREIPSVKLLIELDSIKKKAFELGISQKKLVYYTRDVLKKIRDELKNKKDVLNITKFCETEILVYLDQLFSHSLVSVINATGVVLHTNLGRAPLPLTALKNIENVCKGYCNLEFSIDKGTRSSRHDHIETLLVKLTGAESALVVNNNAAAVFIVLRELAANKEVIISRSQIIEIGGSFRISEIMKETNSQIVEIGTTNKTRIGDYEKAINDNTGMLLSVHQSNFFMSGFVSNTSADELVGLGNKYSIPVYHDMGSGILYDIRSYEIANEPTVKEMIKSGVDIITFSGDKLLGGPQAGIIVGKSKYLEQIKKNQLIRMLRADKLSIAALESILLLYLSSEKLVEHIPVLKMLLEDTNAIKQKAQQVFNILKEYYFEKGSLISPNKFISHEKHVSITLSKDSSAVGGGALPAVELPTWIITIEHNPSINLIEKFLRKEVAPAIISRQRKSQLIFDFRTIFKSEISYVAKSIIQAIDKNLV
jgi:L-seryl-tRNA(Ser) seleniumtransferase